MLKCNFQYHHADFMLNVELEMQQVHIGRNLLGPADALADGQHLCKVAVRALRHQVADPVPEAHQALAEVPDHPLRAAIGKHGNGRVIDEKDVHGSARP